MRGNALRALTAGLMLSLLGAPVYAANAVKEDPAEVVQATTDRLLQLITENKETYRQNPREFYKVMDQLVLPRFDWPYISKLILARNWESADQALRDRFATAFQSMLLKTYADALLEYHDAAKVQWLGSETHPSKPLARVSSQLLRAEGAPIPVGFAMHQTDSCWKVYDISIDSISLINSFRGQFSAEIRNNGLEALIKRLESTKIKSAQEAVAEAKG